MPITIALLAAVSTSLATAGVPDCTGSLAAASNEVSAVQRPIMIADLIGLRDIGPNNGYDSPTAIGVSPDGKSIAFQMRRADADHNTYCLQLIVMPLDGKIPAKILDEGGELVRPTLNLWNLIVAAGHPDLNPVAWSPDGQWLAYRKRYAGSTQLWIVNSRGEGARQLSHAPVDVERFAWRSDSRAVIIATRPDIAVQKAALGTEARDGYLYGDRFSPMIADHPLPQGPFATAYSQIDIETGAVSIANEAEAAPLDPTRDKGRPKTASLYRASPSGARAWTLPRDPDIFMSPSKLERTDSGGRQQSCASDSCSWITDLWWDKDGRTLFYLKREGWGLGNIALYAWASKAVTPRRLFTTPDVITGCAQADNRLICSHEGSAQPRSLISIDLHSGRRQPLFEPNANFGAMRLGHIQRLQWTNSFGIEAYGNLILPPDHQPGQKHPLIVVQYDARGFQRGGTGDEFPILLFAQRGYAVFTFERPLPYTAVQTKEKGKTLADMQAINLRDWQNYRSVDSALMTGIDKVIATGVIDTAKIGLTGFSAGTSTAQWALIHHPIFAAASFGTCCEDPTLYQLNGGPAYDGLLRQNGYPSVAAKDEAFWQPLSLAMNAKAIKVPLLLQIGDGEYEMSLETYGAWRDAGNPAELYVFPGEAHVKAEPAHRRAIYLRNLDWFDFWLMGKENPDPSKAAQYQRWRTFKAKAPLPTSATHGSAITP